MMDEEITTPGAEGEDTDAEETPVEPVLPADMDEDEDEDDLDGGVDEEEEES